MARKIGVTFVSRRNSLRSILAEACLMHLDTKQRFAVCSCGQPGHISDGFHPAAIGALRTASIPLPKTAPRSWDELARSNSPKADFIITLDPETEPLQPRWPDQPDAALWAFPDLAAIDNPEEVAVGAVRMLYALRRRLELLICLPMQGVDRTAIRSDVRDLAHLP
jgi:protein-tyrosine-phosphatase